MFFLTSLPVWSCGGTNSLRSPCATCWTTIWWPALGFRDCCCKGWPFPKPCLYSLRSWEHFDFFVVAPYLKIFRSNPFMSSGLRKGNVSWGLGIFAPVKTVGAEQAPFVLTPWPWLQGSPELRCSLHYHNVILFKVGFLMNWPSSFYSAPSFFCLFHHTYSVYYSLIFVFRSRCHITKYSMIAHREPV